MKTVLLVLAMASGLLAADAAVTEGLSNGRAWKGMAVEVKFVYLVGLSDGLRQAQGELVPALFSKPTPGQDEKAAEIIPDLLSAGKGFPTMIAALDEFYGDALNLDIPITIAARFARAKLEGRDPKQLAETLSRLRSGFRISKELDSLQKK
jgi:hypothetical protein